MRENRCSTRSGHLFIVFLVISLIFLATGQLGYAQETASLIEGAKKEGRVNLYTGMTLNPDVKTMVGDFEKKYPFIKVDVLRMSGEKLLTKAMAEANAKMLKADIFQASIVQVSHLKENNLLMKYISPESKAYSEKFRDPEGYWTATYILPYVITYNTRLVSKDEAPKTYDDLLDPKWKGKIGIESEELQWFFHLMKIKGREKGLDYMKKLAAQDLAFRKGHPLLLTLSAAGEIPIVVVGYLNEVMMRKSEGAPLDWVRFKTNPTITAINAISIISTAPHPNAAKLFNDFVISRNGAKALRKVMRIPARVDEQPSEVQTMNLYPAFPDELLANYKQVVKEWEEIFHPN